MIQWQTIQALLFTLAPFLIPRLYSYYKSLRTEAQTSLVPHRPVPKHVRYAINILFVASALAALSTLPHFSPENIFTLTQSRLHTPNDVLFNRLSALRPNETLTSFDDALRLRLASLDGRCLYFVYGPSITADCPFCKSDDPSTFLYYALPSLLFPHILNLFAIGLATSSAISGNEGGRWRMLVAVAGSVLALMDCAIHNGYEWKANSRVSRAEELVFFYWTMRVVRGIVISLLDAGIAALLWVSSTNRMFVIPMTSAERLEIVAKTMEGTRGKLGGIGVVRNATYRDETLRRQTDEYWKNEKSFMGEIMDEREVVDGIRNTLESGRLDLNGLEEEATRFADGIVWTPA